MTAFVRILLAEWKLSEKYKFFAYWVTMGKLARTNKKVKIYLLFYKNVYCKSCYFVQFRAYVLC